MVGSWCPKWVFLVSLQPFGQILELVPCAESVVKLKAVCMVCYREAAFTKRLGSETAVEVIGGADKYMAVCRSCFHIAGGVVADMMVTPTRELPAHTDSTTTRELFPPSPSNT